jgi:hypothetical protein
MAGMAALDAVCWKRALSHAHWLRLCRGMAASACAKRNGSPGFPGEPSSILVE